MKLTSRAIPSSEAFQTNRAGHLAALEVVQAAAEAAAAGGGDKARARHLERGKMLPRDRVANLLDPGAPFLEIGATAAHGLYDGAAPGAGVIAGMGRVHGPRGDGGLQRCHREGRHLLPDDRQETPARAGDRRGEPSALHLSGRQRRREPAQSGRGLPRSRPFRAHLLQSGQDERQGHPADRGRHGLLHRGRGLCARDVGCHDHRARSGHDLSGRSAAGQGRDGRGRDGRGSGRRRCAHAPVRCGRLSGRG